MKVYLPFPPKELSPNARKDRRAIAGLRAAYKNDCYLLTRQARHGKQWDAPAGEVALRVTFIQPDKRLRDADNLMASAKSGIDGFALGIGIDDRFFRPLIIDWQRGPQPGALILELVPA